MIIIFSLIILLIIILFIININGFSNEIPFITYNESEIKVLNDAKIAVIIPCIPKHYCFLPECIKSINRQHIKPTQIIITMSESNENIITKCNKHLRKFTKIPIIISTATEKQYAGENRNRGYKYLNNDIDYVCFFDADDIMTKTKLRDSIYFMKKYNSDLLVHSYTKEYKKPSKTIQVLDSDYIKNTHTKQINDEYGFEHCLNMLDRYKVQRGHITVTKKLFDNIKFPSFKRGEDQQFITDTIYSNYKLIFINKVLSIYNEHRSSENL